MIKGHGWASETVKERYSNSFYFYFIKPINSIVAGEPTAHSIQFRDFLYWDQEEEIMRRFYTIPESEVRLKNYIASYMEIYDRYPPNLCIIKPFKVLNKRTKRFLKQIKREQEDEIYRKNRRRGFEPMLPQLMKNPVYLTSRDFSTSFLQTAKSKLNISQESEDMLAKVSFETVMHDIYDPQYSSHQSEAAEDSRSDVRMSRGLSKSKVNLIRSSHQMYAAAVANPVQTTPEGLSDLFQKYRHDLDRDKPQLTSRSGEKFKEAIRGTGHGFTLNLNGSTIQITKKGNNSKKKPESTNATERDSNCTKDIPGSIKARVKGEIEEKMGQATKTIHSSGIKENPFFQKKIKHFGKALKVKLDGNILNRTPGIKTELSQEDICSTKRSVEVKSKKKHMTSNLAQSSTTRSLVAKKGILLLPSNKQRLLEKLNTDRSNKKSPSKWLMRDTSKSKTHYDLFKSVKVGDSALRKQIRKMTHHTKISDSKPSQAKQNASRDLTKVYQSMIASDMIKPILPFYVSKIKSKGTTSKLKQNIELVTGRSKSKGPKKAKMPIKTTKNSHGQSLANMSISNDKTIPHYLSSKKFSVKELSKAGLNLHITMTQEPKTSRQSTSRGSKKFGNLVTRLIENSHIQGSKTSRSNNTDRFAYFNDGDPNKKHFRCLFTPLSKNMQG